MDTNQSPHHQTSFLNQKILLMQQQKQLLLLELNQMKQRYENLKREQSIVLKAGIKYCCGCSGGKVEEMQKHIGILTEYISLKDKMNGEKIERLEVEVKEKKEELERLRRNVRVVEEEKNEKEIERRLWQEKVEMLEYEKKQLQYKVSQCMNILKQSQQYYIEQIQNLRQELQTSKPKRSLLFTTPLKQTTIKLNNYRNNNSFKPIQIKLKSKSRQQSQRIPTQPHSKQNNQPMFKLKVCRHNKKDCQNELSQDYLRLTKGKSLFQSKRQSVNDMNGSFMKVKGTVSPFSRTPIKGRK